MNTMNTMKNLKWNFTSKSIPVVLIMSLTFLAFLTSLMFLLFPASSRADEGSPGPLHVQGTQLMDDHDQPVQLRGISTHGIAWFPQYINEDLFHELHADWHADVIRLAMYTAESGGYCTDGDPVHLKDLIDQGIQYATQNGLYVIVDWHILSDNNPNQYRDEAIAFFKETSARYADHDNILYEICNEPNGPTSWQEIRDYALSVIPVIRENDPDAVILIGTPNWSQFVDQAAADPITEYDNLMYVLHFYAATHKQELRDRMCQAMDDGLPIFVSEYGICDASGNGALDLEEASAWITLMNEREVSYVAWNLSNKNESSAIIQPGCSKTSALIWDDLSPSGQWLYQTLSGKGASNSPHAKASLPTSDAQDKQDKQNKETVDSTLPIGGERSDEASDIASLIDVERSGETSGSNSSIKIEHSEDLDPAPTSQPQELHGFEVLEQDSLQITPVLRTSWEEDGKDVFLYDLTITNTSDADLDTWSVVLSFQQEVTIKDSWNGEFTMKGTTLTITPKSYNSTIAAGNSISNIGMIFTLSNQ